MDNKKELEGKIKEYTIYDGTKENINLKICRGYYDCSYSKEELDDLEPQIDPSTESYFHYINSNSRVYYIFAEDRTMFDYINKKVIKGYNFLKEKAPQIDDSYRIVVFNDYSLLVSAITALDQKYDFADLLMMAYKYGRCYAITHNITLEAFRIGSGQEKDGSFYVVYAFKEVEKLKGMYIPEKYIQFMLEKKMIKHLTDAWLDCHVFDINIIDGYLDKVERDMHLKLNKLFDRVPTIN